jgi:signal peptidase II
MKNSPVLAFLIALAVVILDQVTKYIITTHVGPLDVIPVTSFFNIVYVENTGSAFGLFKSLGNIFFILVALLAMIFISVLIVKDNGNRLTFALILGGAAGNLIDRIRLGSVVDFLDFHITQHHWPAFNVADSALTAGVTLLLVKTLFPRKAT